MNPGTTVAPERPQFASQYRRKPGQGGEGERVGRRGKEAVAERDGKEGRLKRIAWRHIIKWSVEQGEKSKSMDGKLD